LLRPAPSRPGGAGARGADRPDRRRRRPRWGGRIPGGAPGAQGRGRRLLYAERAPARRGGPERLEAFRPRSSRPRARL